MANPENQTKAPVKSTPRKRSWRARLLRWVWKSTLAFFAGTILLTILFRFIPIPITGLQLYRVGEAVFSGTRPRLEKDWIAQDQISPHLKQAAMAAEDQNFIEHYGFDIEAIEKAVEYNRKHPKKTRGASTISQQTAKNVFLWPGRNWLRKGLEVYFTLLIETLWSKPRILQVYLNVAEFGDGVYGVEAAARKYFRKPAAKLTRSEAAQLIAVLPNPRGWSAASPSARVAHRRDAILAAMSAIGPQEGITDRRK